MTAPLSVAHCMCRDEGRPDRFRRPAARRTKGWMKALETKPRGFHQQGEKAAGVV